jgi:hypothetical protein
MREIGRILFLILAVLSLYKLLESAFFGLDGSGPGTPWQVRLEASAVTLALATCVCFAGGIFFHLTEGRTLPLNRTLPVQLYYWTVGGTVLLFCLSLYLEIYYVPYLWKNQPW